MAKKSGKKMSAALKSFLKTHGRFPRKGELGGGAKSKSRGGNMARKKGSRKGGSRGQGIASWGTSVIALFIGLSNVIARLKEGWADGSWAPKLAGDFTGLNFGNDWSVPRNAPFDASRLARGYGPIIGAVAFKKGTAMLLKTARIKSVFPRFTPG